MFILEHDKHKINELNQYLKNQWDHVMPPPTYFQGKLIEWRSLCTQQKNDSLSLHIVKTPENFTQYPMLCIFLVGSTVAEKSFSCIRQTNNWLRNSTLMDLLGDLAIIALYMLTRFLFYKQINAVPMGIHPPRMMAFSCIGS